LRRRRRLRPGPCQLGNHDLARENSGLSAPLPLSRLIGRSPPHTRAGVRSFVILEAFRGRDRVFFDLLKRERAGSSEYREYWARKNLESKRRNENLSKLVQRNETASDDRDRIYYSTWYWTAVHILVSIPEYQTEKVISERLSLPLPQVIAILRTLEEWSSVRREKKWKFGAREQHIAKEGSPLSMFHHNNWRQQATKAAQYPRSGNIHFTVVQSLSVVDYDRVKDLVLEYIQKVSPVAQPSAEEKLMCFTCDFLSLNSEF